MGAVALPSGDTVQSEMKKLITAGLARRGYGVSENPSADTELSIDINKFWSWYSPGFASVGFNSEVEASLGFTRSGAETTTIVNGTGANRGQVASNANIQLTYKRAFENFLMNLDTFLDTYLEN